MDDIALVFLICYGRHVVLRFFVVLLCFVLRVRFSQLWAMTPVVLRYCSWSDAQTTSK